MCLRPQRLLRKKPDVRRVLDLYEKSLTLFPERPTTQASARNEITPWGAHIDAYGRNNLKYHLDTLEFILGLQISLRFETDIPQRIL